MTEDFKRSDLVKGRPRQTEMEGTDDQMTEGFGQQKLTQTVGKG